MGTWGAEWCRTFLPDNIKDDTIEVVAAADRDAERLKLAQETLGLRPNRCFRDVREAFATVEADFCTVVTPPDTHERVVDAALEHGLDILCEKPIAETLEASIRVADKVKAAGRKMGVTMSHRFDRDKTTLRRELRSGRNGKLDYLVCRFTCDCRKFGSWGKFRHEMANPLMVEGAVHHLDILADLVGARCETIYAQTWNPKWGEFAGDSQGLVTMQFENGARALYEGAKTNAVGMNCWGQEYIRAECEKATLILNWRHLERHEHRSGGSGPRREGQGEPVALLEQAKWANSWLIEKFVNWIESGMPMETNVEDNLQSMALITAAIESSRTGMPVQVQDLLSEARAGIRAER